MVVKNASGKMLHSDCQGRTWLRIPSDVRFWIFVAQCLILLTLVTSSASYECLDDDVYITFRYSRNLGEGAGWVYNPGGERVLGTTRPLWSLFLASAPPLGLDVVWQAKFLSSIFLFLAALGLCVYFAHRRLYIIGLVSGISLFFAPTMVICWGNEIPLMLCLLIWSVVLSEKKKFLVAGLLAALCALTRGEGFFVCLFVIGVRVYRRQWRDAIKSAVFPILLGIVWIVFATWYFGSPVPHTLGVKSWQGEGQGLWTPYHARVFFEVVRYLDTQLVFGLLIFGIACIVAVPCWGLLIPCVAIIVGYTLLDPPAQYVWYFYPQFLVVALAFGYGCQRLYELTREYVFKHKHLPAILLVMLLTIPLVKTEREIAHTGGGISWMSARFTRYFEVAEKLKEENIPPDAQVLMVEIGIIGYYADVGVLDIFGLVTRLQEEEFNNPHMIAARYQPEYSLHFSAVSLESYRNVWEVQGSHLSKRFEASP